MTRVNALWPRAKSCPQPVFVNKVLLKHSYTQLFRYCLWLPLPYDGIGDLQQRVYGPKRPKYLYFLPLQKILPAPGLGASLTQRARIFQRWYWVPPATPYQVPGCPSTSVAHTSSSVHWKICVLFFEGTKEFRVNTLTLCLSQQSYKSKILFADCLSQSCLLYYDVTFFRWHSDVKLDIACFLFVNFAFLFCVFHSKFLDFFKSLMENLILNTLVVQTVPLILQWEPLQNSSFTLLTQPPSCLKLSDFFFFCSGFCHTLK